MSSRMFSKEEILHFSLQGLIEPEQSLALDKRTGLVVLLSCNDLLPHLDAGEELTPSEICILLPLLEAYPYYCPYEILLASANGQPTERDILRAQERLEDASQNGTWDIEIRPVRNILSRTRIKMRNLGIDILSIIETGYILSKIRRKIHSPE